MLLQHLTTTTTHHEELCMKQFMVLFLALCLILSLATSQAQEKATMTSDRVMPKPGKDAALRKALADHVAKYHTGNWKWRVFSILSGPDAGAYMLNEGPNTWTTLENRKEISDEHTRDYESNVVPLVESNSPALFLVFQKELSCDSSGGKFTKALLRHIYPKPGKGPRIVEYLKTWKAVWQKLGMQVVVWSSFYSGEPQLVVSYRLPQGFVDLEQSKTKALREGFDEVAGPGAYARYLDDLDKYVARISEEMIELLPEVSSK
jgi:hypothetical protein